MAFIPQQNMYPSPQAWMPPPSVLPPMQPMPTRMPAPPMQGAVPPQGVMPQGMPPQAGVRPPMMPAQNPNAALMAAQMGAPQRFANGGSVAPMAAQTPLGGTQIAQAPRYAQGGAKEDHAEMPVDKQLADLIVKNPQANQAVEYAHEQIGEMPLDVLNEFIRLVRFALKHPEAYQQIREAAIKDEMVDPEDMPLQFDPQFLSSMLVTLISLKKKQQDKKTQKLATGGLARTAELLRSKGRGGDTILAHINPREAAMLKANGGSGTINPKTGLPEFRWTLKGFWKDTVKVLKVVAPIALAVAAPYAGAWLAGTGALSWMGAVGANIAGGALSGAVAGGAGAAISGGDVGQGATIGGVLGGIGGGFRGWEAARAAPAAAPTPVPGTTPPAGPSVADANLSVTGRLSPTGVVDTGAIPPAAPTPAPVGGGVGATTSNLASTAATPAKTAVDKMISGAANLAGTAQTSIGLSQGLSTIDTGQDQPSTEVAKAISTMSPKQQEFFNQPLVQLDWNRINADAAASGDPQTFFASNMRQIMSGAYNKSGTPTVPFQRETMNAARGGAAFAGGGALSKMAYLAQGSGSGRADTIDAKLSDGEYVIDAETVALLGDGSTKEGARRLDQMRRQLRQQKGKVLARGKFSPAAKSPLAYLKGAR